MARKLFVCENAVFGNPCDSMPKQSRMLFMQKQLLYLKS